MEVKVCQLLSVNLQYIHGVRFGGKSVEYLFTQQEEGAVLPEHSGVQPLWVY